MSLIKTLMLYVVDGSRPSIPNDWHGMQAVVDGQAENGHAVDEFEGNEVHVFDLAFGSLALGVSQQEIVNLAARRFNEWLDVWDPSKTFDIVVAGQTPLAERCARALQDQPAPPIVTMRFSMYYGDLRSPYPQCSPPAQVYSHDCPKDFFRLLEVLRNANFIRAVRRADDQEIKEAVDGLSASPSVQPILTLFDSCEPAASL